MRKRKIAFFALVFCFLRQRGLLLRRLRPELRAIYRATRVVSIAALRPLQKVQRGSYL